MSKVTKLQTPPIPVLRTLIETTNTKREDLAKAIGVSSVAIGQYYNGETLPSIEKLIKIADYFHVSTDYLLGKTKIQTLDVTIKQICEITGLSESAIEVLRSHNENWPYLLEVINFLIEQETMPPDEAELLQITENPDISNEQKKKAEQEFKIEYSKWEQKDYKNIISVIMDYFLLSNDTGEFLLTQKNLKKIDKSMSQFEQAMGYARISSKEIIETAMFTKLQDQLRKAKQKYLQGV